MLPYQNMTLQGEYDIVEQMYKSKIQYDIAATYTHLYGHQEDDALISCHMKHSFMSNAKSLQELSENKASPIRVPKNNIFNLLEIVSQQ